MKKVLFTATVDSHILQFHLPFLKMFKDNGYEVHVATNGNDEIPYCDVKHFVSFERNPIKINNLKAIKQLKKICEDEKFDIIHTHTPMGSVVTRLAAKKFRKYYHTKVIYTAHGLHFFKGAPLKNWLIFYPVEKWLAKYTDTLILINQEDYEFAKKKLNRCKDIQYIPGVGIDEKKFDFSFSNKEKIELRNSLGLEKDDFVMIYPAELNWNKNQSLIINAMEKLTKKYSNIKVLLPGVDSYDGLYQKIVKEKKLDKNVIFLGYRKDIPKLLKISNLALATSHREGLPLNIMEAMYVGLPVVATNCRGQRDLIENNVNGFLIDINDEDSFIDSIEKIYLNQDNYLVFGEENKKIIKKYLLSSIIKQFEQIYFKKKTIVHLLSSNEYSGAENVACTIIDLMKNDYNMIYCSPNGNIREVLKNKKIDYIPVKKISFKYIKKVIEEVNPDIIHAHDFKASFVASIFYKKCKVISHIHKNDPSMKKISLKSLLFLLASNKFSNILGVSNSILNEFFFSNSIRDKYKTVYNFVDRESILNLSNKFKIAKKYDLFYFGRLSEEKNPLEFIEIVHSLNEKNISCVMIGDGLLKDSCKELIEQYSLQNNIDMIGFQENPFPYIKASSIGVMPSKFEGFGLTTVESIILQKPIFNSGVGGLNEIFENNQYYICLSNDDYVTKIKDYMKKKQKPKMDFKIIDKYCNKDNYKYLIKELYK